jgi:NADH dehydrogenase (ubiquinone) 1 alpha subcomplex subunit 6
MASVMPVPRLKPSQNFSTASKKSVALYRKTLKSIPALISLYQLEQRPLQIQAFFRSEFEKQRHVTDVKVIDVLHFKGDMELVEALNLYKTKHHVQRLLEPALSFEEVILNKDAEPSTFQKIGAH